MSVKVKIDQFTWADLRDRLLSWFTEPSRVRLIALLGAVIYYSARGFVSADGMSVFTYAVEMPGIFLGVFFMKHALEDGMAAGKYANMAVRASCYMLLAALFLGALDIFLHGKSTW